MVVKQTENRRRCPKQPEQLVVVVVVCVELPDRPESYPDPHAHILWSMVITVEYVNSSERMSSMTLSIGAQTPSV